jgi:hypothetical protein
MKVKDGDNVYKRQSLSAWWTLGLRFTDTITTLALMYENKNLGTRKQASISGDSQKIRIFGETTLPFTLVVK